MMKRLLMAGIALSAATLTMGQQKQGRVAYERISQIQIHINDGDGNDALQNALPTSRTDHFELFFSNGQSLWRHAEEDNSDEGNFSSGGMQIRMIGAGMDDVIFNNFESAKRTELREMFDKKFVIDDSIRSMKWKMTGETKMILNHPCMKATASQVSKRMTMNMDNGKMERKEIEDTSVLVAWFTSDIPVPGGPAEYQGQLPGLILELDVANGRVVFRATEISEKADLALIKAPTAKRHYTREEFRAEVNKMMEEMQQNNGGPGMRIRIAN